MQSPSFKQAFFISICSLLLFPALSLAVVSGIAYPDSIYSYEDVDKKPEIVKKVMPEYPEEARKSGLEGAVVLRIVVDEKGNVIQTECVKSVAGLDEAAKTAALKTKFKPAEHGSEYVKVELKMPFMFKLD